MPLILKTSSVTVAERGGEGDFFDEVGVCESGGQHRNENRRIAFYIAREKHCGTYTRVLI